MSKNLNFNTQFPMYKQSNQIPGHQFQKVNFYFVAKFIVLENTNFTKPQQNLNFKTQLPIFEPKKKKKKEKNQDFQFHKFNISQQNSDFNAKNQNQKIKN